MTEQTRILTNLPRQTTSFVGRCNEIAEISVLLENPCCQLLTLTGPGGVGKTRLALAVAEKLAEQYVDGVYFVSLQPLRAASEISSTICETLALTSGTIPPKEQLLRYLCTRHVLLVIDNFENVLDGGSLVAELVAAAPRLKILVTSRELLHLKEEWVWSVSGLEYPDAATIDDLARFSAVRLFVERAKQANHHFTLCDDEQSVIRICQLVEGAPLALELASGWTRTLTCAEIARQVERTFDFLTSDIHNVSERHHSVRAVFSHSWRLMFEDERIVFQRFAIFRSGAELEAVVALTGASLPMLASFVDKSLLHRTPGGRFQVHELLRQFAEERLCEAGELDRAMSDHSRYYLGFLSSCEADIKGTRQLEALAEVSADFENVRAAWLFAVDRLDYGLVASSLEALYWFCTLVHWVVPRFELIQYAKDHLEPLCDDEPATRLWGRLLAFSHGSDAIDSANLRHALTIAERYNDQTETAICLTLQGQLEKYANDYSSALRTLEISLRQFVALGNDFWAVVCLWIMANASLRSGKLEQAIQLSQRGAQIARAAGDQCGLAGMLWAHGGALHLLGRFGEAERTLLEAQRLYDAAGDHFASASVGWTLADHEITRGNRDRARIFADKALAIARDQQNERYQGRALVILSDLALLEGNYEECEALGAASLTLLGPGNPVGLSVKCTLAQAALASGDETRAADLIVTVLEQCTHPIRVCLSLVLAAALLVRRGNFCLASEVLGYVMAQPESIVEWLTQRTLLTELRQCLEARVDCDELQTALVRGAAMDARDVVERSLTALRDSPGIVDMPERLTERETEVLQLIAHGYSNRQIAQVLGVTLGTVKAYTHRLYQKLDVESRVQAVSRAQTLHLL